MENNVACSSGSNLRSSLIGMGFLPSLVDKVIKEKGEDDADLLVETLFAYSDLQKSNAESEDSLDSLFDDKGANTPEVPTVQPNEDLQKSNSESEDSLDSLFDDKDANIPPEVSTVQPKEETSNDTLFEPMDKTFCLLQMGFTENQVSAVIEKFGPHVPLSELVDSIFAGEIANDYLEKDKECGSSVMGMKDGLRRHLYGSARVKTEDLFPAAASLAGDINRELIHVGKRPKQEFDYSLDATSQIQHRDFSGNREGRRLKQEYTNEPSSFVRSCLGEKGHHKPTRYEVSTEFKSSPCRSLDRVVAKSPYFFYGNVVNVSNDSWAKISRFLYAVAPEFVNAQFFSALSRKEGYVHNLPTKSRFHIDPRPPMTIEDAIPHTKRWWPSWDTRKQLSCITSEISGISQLCDRLGKILNDSRGLLSPEQQKDILHQCRTLNLVWVGRHKLSPIEPEHLESILGYPLNHTQDAGCSLIERLQALKHCFQTDTLGYHLSVLKSMYPDGLTMLSIFSGIGGAEVALHRLGVCLKGVVSVETCATKRRILKRWWENSGQSGELVQIEDIQKLTSNKIKSLMDKLGGFDFVICQSPCSNSSLSPNKTADSEHVPGFDFSLFYEFVRCSCFAASEEHAGKNELTSPPPIIPVISCS